MKLPDLKSRIAIVFCLMASAAISAEPSDPEYDNAQQATLLLWTAGDYPEAIKQTVALMEKYSERQRSRTAFFHVANLLENKKIIESQTVEEARDILRDARTYYQDSLKKIPNQAGHVARQSEEGVKRTEVKIAKLDAILAHKTDFRIGSEQLSDIEASRPAVVYLRDELKRTPSEGNEIYFLMLVHQNDYVDGLSARLAEVYSQLKTADPELFEKGRSHFIPMLQTAATDAVSLAAESLEKYPDSPHLLDYHVYLGNGYRYEATTAMAERDALVKGKDESGAAKLRTQIIENLENSKSENAKIIALTESYRAAIADPADPKAAANLTFWDRHKEAAQERILDLERLLLPFKMEAAESEKKAPKAD